MLLSSSDSFFLPLRQATFWAGRQAERKRKALLLTSLPSLGSGCVPSGDTGFVASPFLSGDLLSLLETVPRLSLHFSGPQKQKHAYNCPLCLHPSASLFCLSLLLWGSFSFRSQKRLACLHGFACTFYT